MAPEVWRLENYSLISILKVLSFWKKYSFGADIFCLGCILVFYINQGRHLFSSKDEIKAWKGLEDDILLPGYSPALRDLVKLSLEVEHRRRPAASKIQESCTRERMRVHAKNIP